MVVQQEIDRIIPFIRDSFNRAGLSHAVVGVSGGIDSAVALALAVRALGEGNVFPLILPYGTLSTQGTLDAVELINILHIPLSHIVRIDIKPAVDGIIGRDALGMDAVRKGNVMARVRMIYLFDQAKKKSALVIGTENKSERFLGYFTRYGDSASDIEPIGHLYKTEVRALAEELHIPQAILDKAPSAGLWPQQSDEGEFGFTYEEADPILRLLCDEKKSVEEIVASGFSKDVVEKVASRLALTSFKHHVPYRIEDIKGI